MCRTLLAFTEPIMLYFLALICLLLKINLPAKNYICNMPLAMWWCNAPVWSCMVMIYVVCRPGDSGAQGYTIQFTIWSGAMKHCPYAARNVREQPFNTGGEGSGKWGGEVGTRRGWCELFFRPWREGWGECVNFVHASLANIFNNS